MNYLFDMKKVYMIIIVNIINTVVHLLKYLKNTNCWNWAIHKKDKLCYKSIKYLQLNLTTLNRDLWKQIFLKIVLRRLTFFCFTIILLALIINLPVYSYPKSLNDPLHDGCHLVK